MKARVAKLWLVGMVASFLTMLLAGFVVRDSRIVFVAALVAGIWSIERWRGRDSTGSA